nr:uncharacterized protein LOC128703245 [Cherax quadricarinatus]
MGDFNFRQNDWNNMTGNLESSDFLDTVQDWFLEQVVTKPTRGNNLLDLVLANKESLINNLEVNDELGESDHKSLSINISWNYPDNCNQISVPDFRLADFKGLKNYLGGLNWDVLTMGQMKSTIMCVLVVMLVGSIMGKLSPPERSYKILMLLPISSKSHRNIFMPLAVALADRGHKIVMLTNQPKSSKHPNIEDIPHDLSQFREEDINFFESRKNPSGVFQLFEIVLPTLVTELYKVPVVKDLYERRKEFDVIVIDQLFNEIAYPSCTKFPSLPFQLRVEHISASVPGAARCWTWRGTLFYVLNCHFSTAHHCYPALKVEVGAMNCSPHANLCLSTSDARPYADLFINAFAGCLQSSIMELREELRTSLTKRDDQLVASPQVYSWSSQHGRTAVFWITQGGLDVCGSGMNQSKRSFSQRGERIAYAWTKSGGLRLSQFAFDVDPVVLLLCPRCKTHQSRLYDLHCNLGFMAARCTSEGRLKALSCFIWIFWKRRLCPPVLDGPPGSTPSWPS